MNAERELPLPTPAPLLAAHNAPRTVYELTRELHQTLIGLREAGMIEVRNTFALYVGHSSLEPVRLTRPQMLDKLAVAMQKQIADAVAGR